MDNLVAANDRVLQPIDRLDCQMFPVPAQTGGQKFEVRVDLLSAYYSYRYFGKGQGVSVYMFRDERDLLWYSTTEDVAS